MSDVETRSAMRDTMQDIREAERELRAEQSEAWRRYVRRVDAILAFDLQVERDRDDDDHDPTHLVNALRTRVGELRLQTHLGAMEGEELVGRLRALLRRLST